MELTLDPGLVSVCRLDPGGDWPIPPAEASVYSATRTAGELSVVCSAGAEPPGSRVEVGWRTLRVVGPLEFDLVGVVASLTVPLAEAEVSVFVLSTYDTDLVLVKDEDVDLAVEALVAAGHSVTDEP